ncbi:hypothetical protein EJ06DRAFT_544664 [Trichodelitschia bisporula]|uniref:UBC core domain-containing protein n=1 Tax=Trichodelitschia bisporula TaxID=703511 RepID=A0A6G1HP21_9PEZI|nr:hypothetical protein EJ06DRAFT_544664 [Trichodelitschia bisporula]
MARLMYLSELCRLSGLAQVGKIPGISCVSASDEDGEFTFILGDGQDWHFFTVVVSDVMVYPHSHVFTVFSQGHLPDDLSQAVDGLGFPYNMGATLTQLLGDMSRLYRHMAGQDTSATHHDPGDDLAAEDMDADTMEETICSDLRLAKRAGFRVGVHGKFALDEPSYVLLSIRISKLGISSAAMAAWEMDRKDYLLLAIQYSEGYVPMSALNDMSRHQVPKGETMLFRVGVSRSYKPSLKHIINAFSSSRYGGTSGAPTEKHGFRWFFIANTLNNLLNERLVPIVNLRATGFTWVQAGEKCANQFENSGNFSNEVDSTALASTPTGSVLPGVPPVVQADHILDDHPAWGYSFPLVAMQFVLRRFVRCTDFCVVCHRKIPGDLEAIKPDVCDKPLCLYQYMALGLGPSIENDIRSQPYVVDLLISFAYARACSGNPMDHACPSGMGLEVPNPEFYTMNIENVPLTTYPRPSGINGAFRTWFAWYTPHLKTLNFVNCNTPCPFRNGEWISVRTGNKPDASLCFSGVVSNVVGANICIQDVSKWPNAIVVTPIPIGPFGNNVATGTIQICFHVAKFDTLFDHLVPYMKAWSMQKMLCDLPSVTEMQQFLQNNHWSNLSEWTNRISSAALGMLRWIIASNRAFIVHVDTFRNDPSSVWGMPGWVQFRVAMGAPDKEARFKKAVDQFGRIASPRYPTIFAFHGSPITNWHRIIREGLNYDSIAHGRSYGHGVYCALQAAVSLPYARDDPKNPMWPNSMLKMTAAISLNEIVNAPNQFVSRAPHFVVDKADWIQARYLFVRCATLFPPERSTSPPIVQELDPVMRPVGVNGEILIIPKLNLMPQRQEGDSQNPIELSSDDSDETDLDDRELLASPKQKKKPAMPLTDFIPGTLDYSELPQMAAPSNSTSSATNRLRKEFQRIIEAQEKTPLHELGWYTDPNQMSNMYQWIFELHSFDPASLLAMDMKGMDIKSIVLEMRFPANFPLQPPFVRVLKPRFLALQEGGGGHVTAGGSVCLEMLTNTGWSPTVALENILQQIRLAMTSGEPPARLNTRHQTEYSVHEAYNAYLRACRMHGWTVPEGFQKTAFGI